MALLPSEQILPLLVCPRCRASVTPDGGRYRCVSETCVYARQGFPLIGAHPGLIDFERSIVDEPSLIASGGTSQVPRGNGRGAGRWLKDLYSPPNKVAERHAADLCTRLRALGPEPRVLVVGGGTIGNGARALYDDPGVGVIAFDIYASPWTQFIADAHTIPLPDACVDAVWVQAVLEHVLDPRAVVAEIVRVLRPAGMIYAETPFLQQVHEGPYDFTRFTESGHRWLFRRFERVDSGVVAGAGNQLVWTLDYTMRGLLRSTASGKVARIAAFWVQALDAVIPERFSIDAASCVFFYGRKSERELHPREIVAHYRGAQRRGS